MMRFSSIALLLSLCCAACVSDVPAGPVDSGVADTTTGMDASMADTGIDTGVVDTGTIMDTGADSGTCITGTLAWWRGEDNALDELGNTHLMPYPSSAYTINGHVNHAFDFDNQNMLQLEATNAPQWMSATSFSITGWLNPKGDGVVLQQYQQNQNVITVALVSSKLHVKISTFDGDVHNVTVSNGTWTFIGLTCTGTTLTAWLGNQVQMNNVPSCGLGGGPFRVGRALDATSQYVGLVDELALYGRALASNEVDRIFQLEGAGAKACKTK